jgi:5,10-methylenetetrahydrofolate reductase
MEKILFEVIPPSVNWPEERVESWVKEITGLFERSPLRMLNIPEVVNETTKGERTVKFVPKIDTLYFADLIRRESPWIVPIINKISVRVEKEDFLRWLKLAYEDHKIRHFVLVGGESSKIKYPGYPVIDAAMIVKERYPSATVGGITIFTRPKEPERILAKVKSGMTFFVSQIIFEAENMIQVLTQLKRRVEEEGVKMPRIYVSIAPATKKRDIEFMRWLGVEFPTAILHYFLEDEEKLEERTTEVIFRILDEIDNFVARTGIDIGLNFEHVMYRNLEVTFRLLEKVREFSLDP